MPSKLPMGVVMVAPDGGFLGGMIYPLDLAVGSGMVRLGEPCARCHARADAVEHAQVCSALLGRRVAKAYRRTGCRYLLSVGTV
jgi:hypothetical protein